jgi:hypothetical protein
MSDEHYRHSVLREVILEHLLVGELLRVLWSRGVYDAEVLRSEFDAGGYDLVVSRRDVTRHVQLKATVVGGTRSQVGVNLGLTGKPSGCVVWMFVTDDLRLDHLYFFGDEPGFPMPDIIDGKIVRHTKGNSLGQKLERPKLREVRKSAFVKIANVEGLLDALLGSFAR